MYDGLNKDIVTLHMFILHVVGYVVCNVPYFMMNFDC